MSSTPTADDLDQRIDAAQVRLRAATVELAELSRQKQRQENEKYIGRYFRCSVFQLDGEVNEWEYIHVLSQDGNGLLQAAQFRCSNQSQVFVSRGETWPALEEEITEEAYLLARREMLALVQRLQ